MAHAHSVRSMVGLAVLLAASRVYVGVHYPGDVLNGLALGGLIVAASLPIGLLLLRPVVRWVAHTPTRTLIDLR